MAITIGADPEIGFVKDGFQFLADDIISDDKPYGIGLDGHNDIAEVRTQQGHNCPIKLVNEIGKYLIELTPLLDNKTKVVAGSRVGSDPLGGHIHFGTKKDPKDFVSSLDLFLAVPILCVENMENARYRRGETSYGYLSSYETKVWGFEYRTLSSWLVSKGFALSTISLAFVVASEIDMGKKLPTFWELPSEAPSAFKSADREYFLKYIPDIFKKVRKMTLYPKYATYIASLFGFINAFNTGGVKDWKEDEDILSRWDKNLKRDIPSKYKLSFSDGDYRINEIVSYFNNFSFSKIIRVYGIKDTRNVDVSIYPKFENYEDINFETRSQADIYIGFSKRLRETNIEMCVEITKKVISPYIIKEESGG